MDRGTGERQRAYTKGQKRRRPSRQNSVNAPPVQEITRHQVTVSRAVIEPEALRWFVVRCAPQKEETVVRVFDLCGIPAAIPTTPRERIRRGRMLRWREPVAPSYVLVGFPGDGEIPWWDVLKFGVVRSAVGNNGKPMQVPWRTTFQKDGVVKRGGVEALLPDLDAIRVGAAKYVRMWRQYDVNDSVRVKDGPFGGFEGKVQSITDSEISVLLNIFGRQTPLQLSVGDVVKAA